MNSKCFVVYSLLFFSIIGCNKHSDEEYKALSEQLKTTKKELAVLKSALDKAKTELNKLKETPEVIFRLAVKSMGIWEEKRSEGELEKSVNLFEKLISQFPESDLVRKSKLHLRKPHCCKNCVRLKTVSGQRMNVML